MRKLTASILALALAGALSCGGDESSPPEAVAKPGTEVPTQTTTEVVPIDSSAPQTTPAR